MRLLVFSAVAIVCSLACTGGETETQSSTEALRRDAAQPIAASDSVFARIDSTFLGINRRVGWPDEFDYAVVVTRDANARVISLLEEPRSESGDWSLAYRHTFDDLGRTTRYESVFRYMSECGLSEARFVQIWDSTTGIPRVTRTVYDSAGTEVEPSECGHGQSASTIDGTPLPSIAALIAAKRMPPVF